MTTAMHQSPSGEGYLDGADGGDGGQGAQALLLLLVSLCICPRHVCSMAASVEY